MNASAEGSPWDPPDDPEELRRFPSFGLTIDSHFWRVHSRRHGPWYFQSEARFGLAAPRGTCYAALDPVTAISEVAIRGQRVLMLSDLDSRIIRKLDIGMSGRSDTHSGWSLADCTDRRSTGFGVTRDMCAGSDYQASHGFAEAVCSAAFKGVRYWARHDMDEGGVSLALFGQSGERVGWRKGRGERLSLPKWLDFRCRAGWIPTYTPDMIAKVAPLEGSVLLPKGRYA